MVETWYKVGRRYNLTLAVLADIHFKRISEFMPILEKIRPDLILIPGDLVNGAKIEKVKQHEEFLNIAVDLLNRISRIAPTYTSIGNHEKQFTECELESFYKSKAGILQERYIKIVDNLYLGGLSSGRDYDNSNSPQLPDLHFIDEFERLQGYKILLCHHPEYYEPYLKAKDVDLIISGHAHGGQARMFNHGLYAPGQGLFPKYTSGMHDGKLIVSRGIAGTELFPRINNEPEIVFIKI